MYAIVDKDGNIRKLSRTKPKHVPKGHFLVFNPTIKTKEVKAVYYDGKWHLKELTEYDKKLEKQKILSLLPIRTKKYIMQHYPDIKQKSDIVDKEYYGALLVSTGKYRIEEVYKKCLDIARSIINKETTLQDTLQQFPEEEREAWEQLIKVAVRVGWVQMVKAEYKRALQEQRLPDYPPYPFNGGKNV